MNKNKIEIAVILAAGKGTRIHDAIEEIPKGFILINDKPIIERSIELLLKRGIERIVIVTGFLSHCYDALRDRYPQVETVKNIRYAESGSMFSLFEARYRIDDDFLLLESDLIYEERALRSLINSGQKDSILISGKTDSGDEVYIDSNEGRVCNITKDLSSVKNLAGERASNRGF